MKNKVKGYKAPEKPNEDERFMMAVLRMNPGDLVEFRDGGFVVYSKDEIIEEIEVQEGEQS